MRTSIKRIPWLLPLQETERAGENVVILEKISYNQPNAGVAQW